jgi:hypothetical protein
LEEEVRGHATFGEQRLKQLEDENAKLKKNVADLAIWRAWAARRDEVSNETSPLEAFGRRFMTVVSEQIASGTGQAQDRRRARAAIAVANGR